MPLPDPEFYPNWQEYAKALNAALALGGAEVLQVEGGSLVAPPGFTPVWQDSGGNLIKGNSTLTVPVAENLFQIDTFQIAEAAIETGNVAPLAITDALIGDAAIVTAKINDLAVNSAKIANAAIISAKIADLAVQRGKIADLAVDDAKIANLAVTSAKIENAAVTTAKINDLAVTTAKIADLAVNTAKIADAAIETAKIEDLAVTSAKIASLIVSKITSGQLDATIDVGEGLFTFTTGGSTLVLGNGFGSAGQFFLWYGLGSPDIIDMEESNATIYLKTDGDAYFGGSLTAGVLTTKAGTSSLAEDAEVETAIFGSNGGPIQVTLSYTFSSRLDQTYPGTSAGLTSFNTAKDAQSPAAINTGMMGDQRIWQSGPAPVSGSATVMLYRSIAGGAYSLVATLGVLDATDTWVGIEPYPTDILAGSDSYSTAMGGSLTFTDPDLSTSNRQYKAVLVARDEPGTFNMVQRINIISVEE